MERKSKPKKERKQKKAIKMPFGIRSLHIFDFPKSRSNKIAPLPVTATDTKTSMSMPTSSNMSMPTSWYPMMPIPEPDP